MTALDQRERLRREQEFHDIRFASDGDEERDRFYRYVGGARRRLAERTAGFGPGDRVLEMGVGRASTGWELARRGVDVLAIDISPVAVERAKEEALAEGLNTIEFAVMNAEHLDADDGSFDGVVGSGILHHLNLQLALREMRRVLRSDGRAVFYEPLGHNPLINRYRARTPDMRTDDEHPLLRRDFIDARAHFGSVDASMHHLTVIACALLPPNVGTRLRPLLDAVDGAALRLPGLRWLAWITVMELAEPR